MMSLRNILSYLKVLTHLRQETNKCGFQLICHIIYTTIYLYIIFAYNHMFTCVATAAFKWYQDAQFPVLFILEHINTLRLRQDGRHFPDDIFKWIFLNENAWISINISLKFVPRGPINNIPTLVQVMAWHRPGDKPLSEPMMVRLPMPICVTWPQWVNTFQVMLGQNPQLQIRNVSVSIVAYRLLTHPPLVLHICVSESGQHWFR